MELVYLKIPTSIIMNINPEIGKNEYITSLLIINAFMADFNKQKLTLVISRNYIMKNKLTTETMKYRGKQIINELQQSATVYIEDEQIPLFEKILQHEDSYTITIGEKIRQILNPDHSFVIYFLEQLRDIKKYKCMKFYCLLKIWMDYHEYVCHLKWLRWYLNAVNIRNCDFTQIITEFVQELKQSDISIKVVKLKDSGDKRKITKFTFNVFNNRTELNNESV